MALTLRAARRLVAQPPTATIRVYTFQHVDAWAAAQARGYLTGSSEHVEPEPEPDWPHDGHMWRTLYDWMRAQMAQRVPQYSGDYPVWAYVKRPNRRQTRWAPDQILIVADVPRWRMLLSEHGAWHIPLNAGYCCTTEAEYDANYRDRPRHEPGDPYPDAMTATWDQIFDLDSTDWPTERVAWCGHPTDIQACVDRIHMHEVVRTRLDPGRLGRRGGQG